MHGLGLLILMALDSVPGATPSGNRILAVLGLGLPGRLVFDGAGTAPFPLSTIIQTSLSAGALTSPSLMSSHRYVSHISGFPLWTFFLLHLLYTPSPPLPSHSCSSQDTRELQKRMAKSLGLSIDGNALTQESGDKGPFSGDVEQDTSSSWAFSVHYSHGFIMPALPTSQGYYRDQMRLKV